jgi:hypothetical protein
MIVVIGPRGQLFTENVLNKYPNAVLCNSQNINTLADIVYTSTQDISHTELIQLLSRATQVEYYSEGIDLDDQVFIESCLLQHPNVTGDVVYKHNYLTLQDHRQSNATQLWIVGCSIADGVGVKQDARWGHLVASELDLPVSFLTKAGTSIEWAADQILRSDIRSNDTLVWGITSVSRFMKYSDDGILQNVHPGRLYKHNIKEVTFPNQSYKASHYIQQVTNFLKKVGCQYRLLVMFPPFEHQYIPLHLTLLDKNAIIGYNENMKFVDIGSDGVHPGPEQHKIYARKILNSL